MQLVIIRMMYHVVTQAYSERENPSGPISSRAYDLPITSSDGLPLSYRRLVGAKAIKIVSKDKHPAYCYDLNIIFMNLVVCPLSLLIHVFAFV